MLPEAEDTVALFTSSMIAGRPLADRMGLFQCSGDAVTLRLKGTLPPGLYRMALVTKADHFDMDTVMLPLTSWPGMAPVKAGPFDFDHTQYKMAVPTFRVIADGYDWGLVWCEVPSPADVQSRRIRAVWGIETASATQTEIVLEVPEAERDRLRWTDVEVMDIRPDERYGLPLEKAVIEAPHPRLFADAARFEQLAKPGDRVQAALLKGLREQAAASDEGKSYEYRTLAMALLGRLTGETDWMDQAIARTMALCERAEWGYHAEPGIMGWNNDRDAGNRMLETAVVFDWLHDRLTAEQKTRIAGKLARHAELAYKVTLLQRNYWYHRSVEAHGQGLWAGFTAAAAALLGHDPRAAEWLAWARGNFDEAARCLPGDGIATWVVFNVFWHILSLSLFERLTGRRHELPRGFFDTYPAGVVQVLPVGARDSMLGSLLCYLADRNRDPEAQANALYFLKLDAGATALRAPRFTAFGLLFYNPAVPAGARTQASPAFASQGGLVCCRGRDGALFGFQCGTPATPRVHGLLNFINRTWYGVGFSGSFSWRAPDANAKPGAVKELVTACVGGYSVRSEHANIVTVDGGGHALEARWVGATVPLSRVPAIEALASGAGATACAANLASAFAAGAGVLLAGRRWWFLHELNLLAMFDRIRTGRPGAFAWHAHGVHGEWSAAGPRLWQIEEGGHRLAVRALSSSADGVAAGLLADAVVQERVPAYTSGMNRYKNAEWQPELYLHTVKVAPMPALRFRPEAPCRDWELVTLQQLDGPDAGEAVPVHENGAPGVRLPDGSRLLWPCGAFAQAAPSLAVACDSLRLLPGGAVQAFQVTAWSRGGVSEKCAGPLDLYWENPAAAPAGWPGFSAGRTSAP